jgi:hypothetical protein
MTSMWFDLNFRHCDKDFFLKEFFIENSLFLFFKSPKKPKLNSKRFKIHPQLLSTI